MIRYRMAAGRRPHPRPWLRPRRLLLLYEGGFSERRHDMHARIFLAGAVAALLCQPLTADPLHTGRHESENAQTDCAHRAETGARENRSVPNIALTIPRPDTLGDIMAGRGPDPNRRDLATIAIDNATGNKDAAEILSRRLRKFGVTRDDVQNAIDGLKLHAGSEASPPKHDKSGLTGETSPNAF
jgi:hypothetical protein